MTSGFWATLEGRADLNKYGNNRLLLFALEIGLDIEDIDTVASTSLTDGSNDKKCDLLYVDRPSGRVVIAQGYIALDLSKTEAPANKASDLNTTAAWLLGRDFTSLPDTLKAAAQELDSALEDDVITSIEFWYCHNLPESENVKRELQKVESTAESLLRRHYPDAHVESVAALEVGAKRLDEWLKSIQVPIYVLDNYTIDIPGGFETAGDRWTAFTTAIPAKWLHRIYSEHNRFLFSANVRDYLGSRASDKNINHNIKLTAKDNPKLLWAFNNGLTALVNNYELIPDSSGNKSLKISGIAIVNGAQTTGAIGSLEQEPDDAAQVLARFVKCRDKDVLFDIIRYNNTQNKVEPSDFRSGDTVQERLRREFSKKTGLLYRGGRRGGEEDKIQRPRNLVPSDTAAQALASFHGEPNIAYNEKSRIWESDAVYSRFFNERTSADHVVFCFSLVRTIEELKQELLAIPEPNRTDAQKTQIVFFRKRGSIWLLCSAMSKCVEIFISRAIADPFKLSFINESDKNTITFEQAVNLWKRVVRCSLPFVRYLIPSLEASLKKTDVIREDIERFSSLVEAARMGNESTYTEFASNVRSDS